MNHLWIIRARVGALGALIAFCIARHRAYRSTAPNGWFIDRELTALARRLAS